MSRRCLEDFPAELFFCLFDYFWAHELFYSFAHLNSRIEEILSHCQLHISAEHHDVIDYPDRVLSLVLTRSPISLENFVNLRSLKLIQCHFTHLNEFPSRLSRLSIENVDLSLDELRLIFHQKSLRKIQLNLHHQIEFSSSIFDSTNASNSIRHLTLNYLSLNDFLSLIFYLPKLKSLNISLIGYEDEMPEAISPLTSTTHLTCLSLNIPFDILCSQFFSIYFPNLLQLSIFTSYVDPNVLIESLEKMFRTTLIRLRKFTISVQIRLPRTSTNDSLNLETIRTRFRTAFWLKRNCRVTFKSCQNDLHTIRLYLQTNVKRQNRPSRFGI